MSKSGTFVWHDLMTRDLPASYRFYSQLFGWTSKDDPQKAQHYLHVRVGDRDVGGMIPIEKGQPIPPHWIGYVQVQNVDEAMAAATSAGGKVRAPAREIEVGKFAVVADPHGAVVAPFFYKTQKDQPAASAQPGASTFCWDELSSPDPDASLKFYARFFGWSHEKMDMGTMTYYLFKADGQNVGGMMKMQPGTPMPNWLAYVAVENADRVVEQAKKLGANVVVPPTDIPNVGRFAIFIDPQQAALGILQPAPRQ
jgi:predicted enzyme related to lactoylglutathione lyase